MKDGNEQRHLFDDPRNVRRVIRSLLTVCVVLVGLDLVVHRHVEHAWEGLFAFYALYGFIACVLLVLLAKEMRKIVMRDEDYYTQAPPSADSEHREDSGDV
ncbi:MAG: hypothetical protein KDJ39_18505 [Gammaproteobacteria bacterium]|nr:hypothetical protein [Gammaproteobacteria bacterium]MCP5299462.1 hypothetical protein [Chromatiaceae bacterium]